MGDEYDGSLKFPLRLSNAGKYVEQLIGMVMDRKLEYVKRHARAGIVTEE
jgi:hypothetical protein